MTTREGSTDCAARLARLKWGGPQDGKVAGMAVRTPFAAAQERGKLHLVGPVRSRNGEICKSVVVLCEPVGCTSYLGYLHGSRRASK